MGKYPVFFCAVDDAHDVDISELRAAFAPVTMGHAEVSAHLATSFDLTIFWHGPMEQTVETGDALAGFGGLDVFEESGESADDFFLIEGLGNFTEAI